jgi:hypothetical protein
MTLILRADGNFVGVSGPLTTRIAKKLLQNNIQVVTGASSIAALILAAQRCS